MTIILSVPETCPMSLELKQSICFSLLSAFDHSARQNINSIFTVQVTKRQIGRVSTRATFTCKNRFCHLQEHCLS